MMDYRKSHNFDQSIIAAHLSQFDELENESDEESHTSASDDEDMEQFAQEGSQKAPSRLSQSLEELRMESLKVAESHKKVERKRGDSKRVGFDHNPHRESWEKADVARSMMAKAVIKAPSKRGNHTSYENSVDNVLNSSHASMSSSSDLNKSRREISPPGLTRAASESRPRKHASAGNLAPRMHASHSSLSNHGSDHSSSRTKEENSEPRRRRHPKQSPNVALSRGRSKRGISPMRKQKSTLSPSRRGKKDEITAKPLLGAGTNGLKW
jgi:hypothetical protein